MGLRTRGSASSINTIEATALLRAQPWLQKSTSDMTNLQNSPLPVYPAVKPALEMSRVHVDVDVLAGRVVRKRGTIKHGRSIWLTADVDFGGLVIAPVHVTRHFINWPAAVSFADPELQLKAEEALRHIYAGVGR